MINTTNDGGPAFPQASPEMCEHGQSCKETQGMTLRDYLAAKALQGFCANPAVFAYNASSGWRLVNCDEDQLTDYAYQLADHALKMRDR